MGKIFESNLVLLIVSTPTKTMLSTSNTSKVATIVALVIGFSNEAAAGCNFRQYGLGVTMANAGSGCEATHVLGAICEEEDIYEIDNCWHLSGNDDVRCKNGENTIKTEGCGWFGQNVYKMCQKPAKVDWGCGCHQHPESCGCQCANWDRRRLEADDEQAVDGVPSDNEGEGEASNTSDFPSYEEVLEQWLASLN